MKSTTTVFGYLKAANSKTALNGTYEVKRVFVMNETEDHIQGFDLDKLKKSEQKNLVAALQQHNVHAYFATAYNGSPKKIQGVDDAQMQKWIKKAWRSYKKDQVMDPVNDANFAFTKAQIWDLLAAKGKNKIAVQHRVNAVINNRTHKAYGYGIRMNSKGEFFVTTK